MPVHRVLIERDQEVDSIAEALHFFFTSANREERVPPANNGLIGVVGIDMQTASDEQFCEYISRCGYTLSCGSADRHRKSAIHGPSFPNQRRKVSSVQP